MSTKAELELHSALLSTGMVQPVESHSTKSTISILSRQVPGQEQAWLGVLQRMLQEAEAKGFEVHLCRRYLLRDGQLVFGWHVEVSGRTAKALSEAVEALKLVLAAARPSLAGMRPPPAAPPPAPAPQRRVLAPGQHPPGTLASARPPSEPANVQQAPEGFVPTVRNVVNEVDEQGHPRIVDEFPLPHVYREMNRPNAKGRGAKYTGG